MIESELSILLYWIAERESVRQAKEAGEPKPWTQDVIIRNHRWCNVRRMDDKVSRWLLEKWYDRHSDPTTDLVAALLARLINWPDSLDEALRYRGDAHFYLDMLATVAPALRARAERNEKVFTGAYVVPGVPGMDKIESVVALAYRVLDARTQWEDHVAAGMRSAWVQLMKFDGLGSFLAGQIVADMAFLQTGKHWPDATIWAPVGPGSARGINRLLGRPKDQSVRQAEFDGLLPTVVEAVRSVWPQLWSDRQLVAMDIQNCLCEFDKYRRLQLGEGKVRAKYDGEAAQSSLFCA